MRKIIVAAAIVCVATLAAFGTGCTITKIVVATPTTQVTPTFTAAQIAYVHSVATQAARPTDTPIPTSTPVPPTPIPTVTSPLPPTPLAPALPDDDAIDPTTAPPAVDPQPAPPYVPPPSIDAPAPSGNAEWVYVSVAFDSESKVIVVRRNGEQWLLEYGVGCLALSLFYEGRNVLVVSRSSFFAGIGSKIVIPDRDQECRIWDATQID